jgi:urease accessory protein UreF
MAPRLIPFKWKPKNRENAPLTVFDATLCLFAFLGNSQRRDPLSHQHTSKAVAAVAHSPVAEATVANALDLQDSSEMLELCSGWFLSLITAGFRNTNYETYDNINFISQISDRDTKGNS